MTAEQLIIELQKVDPKKEVIVWQYFRGPVLRINGVAQPGPGVPGHGKIILVGVGWDEEPE